MKNADWIRTPWLKALAFLLAAACAPVIVACAGTLYCAYNNGWWVGTPDLFETDLVRSEVARMELSIEDYFTYPHVADEIEGNASYDFSRDLWFADTRHSNYRFSIYDANENQLYSTISPGDHVYGGLTAVGVAQPGDVPPLQIHSAAAANLPVQDNIYWAMLLARTAYSIFPFATPVMIGAAVLLLLLVIYLALVSGRRPGIAEPVGGWQEKIPFDLYLALLGGCVSLPLMLGIEAGYLFRKSAYLAAGVILAAVAGEAALLLAFWMTFCARMKLGRWWRNTLLFRLLRLLLALVKAVISFLRNIPLVWKTAAILGGMSLLEFITFLNSGMDEANFWLWLVIRVALVAGILWAAMQLRVLQAGGKALAAGDLSAKVDTSRMYWDFKRHGENLNAISQGMQLAVDKQLRSERLKTELITNVSHDIKTPLTSIINYVDLLRRDPAGEQAGEYLDVLDRQSQRLKKLTEDLVEVSKASTGNLPVNASRRSLNELLVQAEGEYSERMEEAGLEPIVSLPEQETFVWVDGALLWRVLDNLFSNACKYALPGTRFYIDAAEDGGKVRMSFKNISRDRLNVSADELMERFVRGDAARGGEGSGLGLNIARSLTELQGGTFSLAVDGDLFRVDITFPLMTN